MTYCVRNCRILKGDGLGIRRGGLLVSMTNGTSRIECVGDGVPRTVDEIIDGGGAILMPAFTDIGCHFFDPRYPSRDSEFTASASASAGGYRRLVTLPDSNNTSNSNDSRVKAALPLPSPDKIAEGGKAVYYGMSGILSTSELCEVFSACRESDSLYISSGIDMNTVGSGSVSSGIASRMNSSKGISRSAECAELAKELFAAYENGSRIHITAISCKEALDMIIFAKSKGVKVTCGVSPFHLAMTDSDVAFYGAMSKLLPPLRSQSDRNALREALYEKKIDCVCSLHTPKTKAEKNLPVSQSPFGLCGIETTLSALLTYMPELIVECPDRIPQVMSVNPAAILGESCTLSEGEPADFVLLDPSYELVVTENTLKSKSVNTPFLGQTLVGRINALYVDGKKR